jgi:xanthine dehydrogenase YagS FAD-binding subunit
MRLFTLERAGEASEALERSTGQRGAHILASVQYLAGGTQLLDLMKLDVMRPERLIDINPLRRDFGAIDSDASGLWLGALVRMAEAADHPVIRRDYPVIAESLWMAASPQLRNMASLAGNLLQRTRCNYFRDVKWGGCNKRRPGSGCAARDGENRRLAILGVSEDCIANYPGDLANALVALDAAIEVLGPGGGRRMLPVEAIHRLPGDTPEIETNLQPGELITRIHVPAAPWARRSRYIKIRDRESYDFALASAAVALDLAGDGVVRTARIGIGGLAAKPWRAHQAEAVLAGRVLDEAAVREAANAEFAAAVVHDGTRFKPELGRRTMMRALFEVARMEL